VLQDNSSVSLKSEWFKAYAYPLTEEARRVVLQFTVAVRERQEGRVTVRP
jgi:hypothetical protein